MRASTGFCSDRQSMISAIVEGRSSVNRSVTLSRSIHSGPSKLGLMSGS